MPPNVHFHPADWAEDEAHVIVTSSLKEDQEESSLGQRLWQKRKQLRTEEAEDELSEEPRIWQALKSILILNDEKEDCQEWLDAFGGTLYSVADQILQDDVPSPACFTAKVADFNENLYYAMQTTKGLNHLGSLHALQDLVPANEHLASFLSTENTIPQPAHVDYSWEILASTNDLQVGFAPLTDDGMFLQVWPTAPSKETNRIFGQIIYIPFGKLLVLPASTIHGGGFRTATHGNLRFHLYLAQNDSKLPDYQTNKYTEPHDKRRELCDRYVDSPFMQDLLECLFI